MNTVCLEEQSWCVTRVYSNRKGNRGQRGRTQKTEHKRQHDETAMEPNMECSEEEDRVDEKYSLKCYHTAKPHHSWTQTQNTLHPNREMCSFLFIAAQVTTARTWKQPRGSSANEWIMKMWNLYEMEVYSTVRKVNRAVNGRVWKVKYLRRRKTDITCPYALTPLTYCWLLRSACLMWTPVELRTLWTDHWCERGRQTLNCACVGEGGGYNTGNIKGKGEIMGKILS